MKIAITLLAAACTAVVAKDTPVFGYGNAVYTYGPLHCNPDECAVVPSCNKAHWAKDVAEFNSKCPKDSKNCRMSIVNSYGGDIEFWPAKEKPQACWAPASTDMKECNVSVYLDNNNVKAALAYRETEGVEGITALLDGRLDGWGQISTYDHFDGCKFGDFYPNLTNLTETSIHRLAQDTAKLYCKHDHLNGVQVDLEPFHDPYRKPMISFLGNLVDAMVDEDGDLGCRSENHTQGRAVSYFCFAHDIEPVMKEMNAAMGTNGYYVFSLYDLDPKEGDGGFAYNTPDEFEERMRKEIPYIRKVVGTDKHFQIALPAGASCHEYEQYVPMKGHGCGPACEPQNNTVATMKDYVERAFKVLTDPQVTKDTEGLFCLDEEGGSQFLGISWWSYSYQMTYPPMKWFDNEFLPGTPPEDALEIIRQKAPLLADGKTTCVA